MVKTIVATLVFSVLRASVPSLNAQEAALPQLKMEIVDQAGAVIPNATVSVTNAITGKCLAKRTDAAGSADFTLQMGDYNLAVNAVGFLNGQQQIDFPRLNAATVTLAVDPRQSGYQGPCCFQNMGPETAPIELCDLIPYQTTYPAPFRLKPRRIHTPKEPQ